MIKGFDSHGIRTTLHRVGWQEGGTLTDKIGTLSDTVDEELRTGDHVSLLGLSAGGALSVATLMEHPELTAVVTVGARLNEYLPPQHSRDVVDHARPFLFDLIAWLRDHNALLTPQMRSKIMTMRVRSGDQDVDPRSTILEGAHNVEVLFDAKNHGHGIRHIMTQEKRQMAAFIKRSAV